MPVLESTLTKLAEEIRSARKQSDQLFEILSPEAIYQRPISQRHRVIFYIGHLDGFDSIQICREALGLSSPDPQLDSLFQAGIDPDSTHLPSDSPKNWPSLDTVRDYVMDCRQRVDEQLEQAYEDVLAMALEHRQMHLETLAYMFHNFPYELKQEPRQGRTAPDLLAAPEIDAQHENEWADIPAGRATLGKPFDQTFGWDNEYEETVRDVPAFQIQRFKVSNGEYLKFIQNGKFVQSGAPLPHFWVRRGSDLFVRGMFGLIPFPADWPVYVTYAEASAYAAWIGKTLPTEEQFHRAAYGSPAGDERPFPWGNAKPSSQYGNFDFRRWDPEPVTATPDGASAFGVRQLVGNGWEWTGSLFAPLPGFQPHSTYPGYSANFFDGEHNVLKGGSPRTPARLLRRSFRNWFRRDYPYLYASFRCVRNHGD